MTDPTQCKVDDLRPVELAGSRYVLTVRALADPGSSARVANVFAQRGIIPLFVMTRLQGDFLLMDIELSKSDSSGLDVMLERIRALVCVDRASVVAGCR